MADTLDQIKRDSLSPLKRTSAAAGLPTQKRPIKRRAAKACQSCRFRKVRCNVVEHGAPCTNCRLDEVDCVLTESKRKRKSISYGDEGSDSQKYSYYSPAEKPRSGLDGLDGMPYLSKPASRPVGCQRSPLHHEPHPLYRNLTGTHRGSEQPVIRASQSDPGPNADVVDDNQSVSHPSPVPVVSSATTLPGYLKPIPTRLGAEERDYLGKKGALIVPDDELRDGLLAAFLEFVYPMNPILDIRDLLGKVNQGGPRSGRVSLLLFQAIMFAGSAYVDLSLLENAGFQSRQEARAKLYLRVRHLYDFDYEMDRFSQVQALLLLTSWYETPEDRKDAWHWMGIVASTAYTIGMHRDPVHAHLDPRQVRLWKRVWWSAVMRDRILSLGMRRPMHIKLEDADVPLLIAQDFELEPFSESIRPTACVLLRDVGMQRTLAEMCVHATRLCLCMGDAVNAQFSVHATQGTMSVYEMQLFIGEMIDTTPASVDVCTDGLHAWKDALPEHISPDVKRGLEDLKATPRSIVTLRAMIQMLYYTTLGTLHRPEVLQSAPTSNMPRGTELVHKSRVELQSAAISTADIAKTLLDLDYVRYLPTTGVTVLQVAIISLLLDLKSPDDAASKRALSSFCYCIQAMNALRDRYNSASHLIALVEAAIRRADIRVSLPKSSLSPASPMQLSEKKANSANDLLAAAMTEGLIPPVCLSPPLPTLTPWHSLIHTDLSNEAEAAAKGRILIPISIAQIPTQTPQAIGSSDIARRMEAFLTNPLPGPEQSSGDFWEVAPVGVDGYGANEGSSEANANAMAYGFDFDAYMNSGPGDGQGPQSFDEQEQEQEQEPSIGSEETMVDEVEYGGSDTSGLSEYGCVSPMDMKMREASLGVPVYA